LQATPCRGCGRPLYPVGSILDDAGQEVWPPASVSRPPMPVPADSEFWYVVGEEEAGERNAILHEIESRGKGPRRAALTSSSRSSDSG
jgi:hypothetical protein